MRIDFLMTNLITGNMHVLRFLELVYGSLMVHAFGPCGFCMRGAKETVC